MATLQQLSYAVKISEAGSINKASEILYVAQPSLTSSIQELEREFGFKIFHRTGRGVILTPEGSEFILYARQVCSQYQELIDRFSSPQTIKKKFAVSTQHYSFAVKAFVELVQEYDTLNYDFAIRETMTRDVISDTASLKSEIGILYLSSFNKSAITKLLRASGLEFHRLITCSAYVYLWAGHPLAKNSSIKFEELQNYPCLSFEQGDTSSFYYAEEILSTREYSRAIKANDRATMLNLMKGLNGYTLCSGIICTELNGNDYLAVPFEAESVDESSIMEVGYITRENTILSRIGEQYIEKIRAYLGAEK
ncbi:MAG: LysR family transcriptional regulator [Synergistaceae bacterium]|nr:LysR family transcriptional regulator [Synergistaceae bacterium]